MRWELLNQASNSLGIGLNTLRSKGARNGWPRKLTDRGGDSQNNQRYVYAVPETLEEAQTYNIDRWVKDDEVFTHNSEPEVAKHDDDDDVYERDEDDDYEVDEPDPMPYAVIGENYVFNLPSRPRHPWVLHKNIVERLCTAYSKDGDNATLNMIAREFGWHRKTVRETLSALGKTHDSSPLTDEQIRDGNSHELVVDLIRRKEEKITIKANRVMWKNTQNLADKARNWNHFVANTVNQIRVPPPPAMPQWKNGTALSTPNELTLVSHATDLHYGKSGWVNQVGEESSRKITWNRLLATTSKLIDRSFAWGRPSQVILGVGADWFHIDNNTNATTKGTVQDTDGTYSQIFEEGCWLARDHIELWRQAVPNVRVVCVRGNHDYYSTSALVLWLQAMYKDVKDVTVGCSTVDREYIQVGNTILGMTHGDSIKDKDLVSLMAHEAKKMWSQTKYRYWLTGHWHSQIMTEHHGVIVEHLPSLAGADAWHHAHGYVGNRKGLIAHMIDHKDGPFARLLVDSE